MDLNQIGTFVRVVDSGTFTAAAAALGLPKSSVSRGVAALEEALGVRLLQRTTRKLSLTDAGRHYYQQVRASLSGLDQANSAVADLGGAPRGTVRLTAPPDFGEGMFPEVIAHFVRRYPGIQLDVVLTQRRVNLIDEGFDLALRAGKLEDSSLVARKIAGSELGLYAAPSYLERRGSPKRLAELTKPRLRPAPQRARHSSLAPHRPARPRAGLRLRHRHRRFLPVHSGPGDERRRHRPSARARRRGGGRAGSARPHPARLRARGRRPLPGLTAAAPHAGARGPPARPPHRRASEPDGGRGASAAGNTRDPTPSVTTNGPVDQHGPGLDAPHHVAEVRESLREEVLGGGLTAESRGGSEIRSACPGRGARGTPPLNDRGAWRPRSWRWLVRLRCGHPKAPGSRRRPAWT